MREAHDAGVAQQQVEAGHQGHEHQHLGRHVERLHAREQERRERQAKEQDDQQRGKPAAAREVVGEQSVKHQILLLNGS
ncbi:hypothetical protein D3C85_1760600 [compost metagenome]